MASVVQHVTPGVEELAKATRVGDVGDKPDLAAGLAQILPYHFQLLVFVVRICGWVGRRPRGVATRNHMVLPAGEGTDRFLTGPG